MLLLLSNLGWVVAYSMQSLDHGITQSYQSASFDTLDRMLDQALVVANFNLVGKPLSEVQSTIEKDSYGSAPFIKEGCLYAGGLCLEIGTDSRIVKVRTE